MAKRFTVTKFNEGRLVRGDSLKYLKEIDEGSIDLVVSSPPYFMGKDYDRSMSVSDFVEVMKLVTLEAHRVLKDGRSLCWQVGSHVVENACVPLDYLVYQICAEFPDLTLRNRIVWTFEHGINSTQRFSGRHETVLWFTKGNDYHFDLDAVRVPQKYPGKRSYKGPSKGTVTSNPSGKNPGDVWNLPNVKANHVEKTDHPCQYPVALVERLIKALTRPNEIILDPFAGSGTTAIAALETDRQFLCIERESSYIKIAKKRIAKWHDGSLKMRDERPPLEPDPNSKVAQRPPEFN